MISMTQIGAQLDAVLDKNAQASVLAIRSATAGDWPGTLDRRGRRFELRWCESRLAFREALIAVEQRLAADPKAAGLIAITPLEDHEVPDDIRSRLARGRVFRFRGWQAVQELFKASSIDTRLGPYDWMPDALVEAAAHGYVQPAPTGFVDLTSAWQAVIGHRLDLAEARPDAVSLMIWGRREDASTRLSLLAEPMRRDLFGWWQQHGDPAVSGVVRAMAAGHAERAGALGFVCDVLYAPGGSGIPALIQAAARLERFVGQRSLSAREGEAWALEARRLAGRVDADTLALIVQDADDLLTELGAESQAALSAWLPAGFEQRIAAYADALERALAMPSNDDTAWAVESAQRAAEEHQRASEQPARIERIRMATRLLRWLREPEPISADLATLAEHYADVGAWADWARFRLVGGDEHERLSRVLAMLRAQVLARREQSNRAFAQAMAQACAALIDHPRVIPIEQVLTRVVVPSAAERNVLLLVIDGLSLPVFRELFELFERSERRGWQEWLPEGAVRCRVGLAALPTVTEVSRASLLTGGLARGASGLEKTGFAAHEALRAVSTSDRPPLLFHKGELATDGELSQAVRDALRDKSQRVVGVVYNAVDDHLSGPDQLHQHWSLDRLRMLLPLLRETHDAGRVLVVTADHGHVLEAGSSERPGDGDSGRWRSPGRETAEGEIRIAGARVLSPQAGGSVVCLWSEKFRYGSRKNGYHGGCAPAEALVPLSVFAPRGIALPGHQLAPPQGPSWWDETTVRITKNASTQPIPKPGRKRSSEAAQAQPSLFGNEPWSPQPASNDDGMTALFASTVYISQRQLAARVAPSDDLMRTMLAALRERGGKLGRTALAQRLHLADVRLGGFLSGARRVLNVDQTPVLVINDQTGTIELNEALLAQQFGLKAQGGKR